MKNPGEHPELEEELRRGVVGRVGIAGEVSSAGVGQAAVYFTVPLCWGRAGPLSPNSHGGNTSQPTDTATTVRRVGRRGEPTIVVGPWVQSEVKCGGGWEAAGPIGVLHLPRQPAVLRILLCLP